ncbi:MAG TPA: phosphoesterase [Thermoleophilia bacterium]|nr:phosphoesterase [Thermoleophilia bacterium]
MIKLFFVTDIHGSNVCYRKFLNALPIYGVDVAVLLGDLTGKVLVPLVEKGNDAWECTLMGQYRLIEGKEALAEIKKVVENAGYYWVHQTREEFEDTKSDPAKIDALFKQLVLARVQEWLDLADERLEGKPHQLFMAPGNDDWFVIDDMIDAARLVRPCDRRVVDLEGHEMITSSASNPTPWDTPREMSEEDLEKHLFDLCGLVKNFETAIFNFHVPPYGYSLDLAPKLDENLTMSAEEKIHAGSIGAKKVIEQYQPLLGLHGHIHESRGAQKAGRTLLINPGSEYSEGILKGALIMLDKKKIKDYVFTSG